MPKFIGCTCPDLTMLPPSLGCGKDEEGVESHHMEHVTSGVNLRQLAGQKLPASMSACTALTLYICDDSCRKAKMGDLRRRAYLLFLFLSVDFWRTISSLSLTLKNMPLGLLYSLW